MATQWQDELQDLNQWHFGGKGSGLEDSLAELVATGVKTATSSWLRAYKVENEPLPRVGQRSCILDSNDKPRCIIEVSSVEIIPFLKVDADFAYLEGEGDRSLEHWQKEHERFFTSYAEELGLKWNPNTESVVCEKFKVLHVFT